MSELIVAVLAGFFAASPALAQIPATPAAAPAGMSHCEAQAIGKNGQPLAGAAKASFIKKCQAAPAADCQQKAVSSAGKPLTGAAKASSIKKCEAEAKARQ